MYIAALVRRRWISMLLVACVAAPAAVIAGCGGGGDSGDTDVGPAAAVPASAALYFDGTVKPTGQTQADATAALGKVMNTPDPGGKIVSLIEQSAKQDGHPFDYQQDVAPWLGEKAGFFFTDLTDNAQKGAAVIETTNPAAALAFARKVTGTTATDPAPQDYNGSSYQTDPTDPTTVFGTVGDFLVTGDPEGFKAAVEAQKGDSLGDDSDFKDALGELPSDRLGTFYTVPKTLIDSLGAGQIDPQSQAAIEKSAGDSINQPVSGALTSSANSFELEFVGGDNGVDTPESALVGDVPADSWLALGLGNLGDKAKQAIEQLKEQNFPNLQQGLDQVQQATGSSIDQLTNALGDAVLYVRGTTEQSLNGALIVQTKDQELTGRLLSQLQTLVQLGSKGAVRPLKIGGGTGFQINDPRQTPQPVEIAQVGDKLVIGYGANSVAQSLSPSQKLSDSPTFSNAKGQISDLGTDFFLDLPTVFRLAEAQGAKSDPGFQRAKPYIDALSYLVTGSGTKGDQAELKAVVGLK
jgi:hypothetical protein